MSSGQNEPPLCSPDLYEAVYRLTDVTRGVYRTCDMTVPVKVFRRFAHRPLFSILLHAAAPCCLWKHCCRGQERNSKQMLFQRLSHWCLLFFFSLQLEGSHIYLFFHPLPTTTPVSKHSDAVRKERNEMSSGWRDQRDE